MVNRAQDDLFENSTMTFGEHLDELRRTLGRALAGLVIGFLIALPFASRAVRVVSSPLEKALSRVYVRKASEEMKARGADSLEAEAWPLLTEEKLIPTTVRMDVEGIVRQLADLGVVSPADDDSAGRAVYNMMNFSAETAERFVTALSGADSIWSSESRKKSWELLSPSEKEVVTNVSRNGADPATRAAMLPILNRLVTETQLYKLEEFQDMKSLFQHEGQRQAVASILQKAKASAPSPQEATTLNRLLLAAALDCPAIAPPPRVIDVRIWEPVDTTIQSLSVQEPFLILIKAALVLGLLISSPWVFLQFWNFVASGLYPGERKYVYTYLPFSLGLFFLGASLAFFFVFQPVLDFLFGFNLMMNIHAVPRLNEWVSFVLFLPIGFGISFQLPLVMLLLERIGIFTVKTFLDKWRIAVLVIFALSMFLTPADPMSMLLMGVPLTALYFCGILLCKYMPQRQSPLGEGYDP